MAYYSGLPMPPVGGLPPFFPSVGKYIFVDPANGSDGNKGDGPGPSKALATLYKAHSLATAGKNDVVVLIGDGGTTGTARLSLALAVTVDSTATTGTLTWSKNATHLVGVGAPAYNQRARIAPPSGTYTQATFNSGDFIEVSASGCYFANVSLFHGFSTGGTSQIALTVSGSRNYFHNVWVGGMGDAASAQNAASMNLLVEGSENVFDRCTIGLDTVARTVANTSLQFSTTSSKRNTFYDCHFPMYPTTLTTQVFVKVATATHSDRWQRFVRCMFAGSPNVGSATTPAAVASLVASIGGSILFQDCMRVGVTDWASDATGLAQCYVGGWSGGSTNHAGDDVGRGLAAAAS